MKRMLKRLVHPFCSRLWRRLCPDIIVQRRIHDTLFHVSLRDHALWVFGGDAADAERPPFPSSGHVWDLGCNIGLYSVQAAQRGCKVTAFDISLTNVLCLRQTAAANGLAIEVVHSPVSTMRRAWTPAPTGHPEEAIRDGNVLPREGELLSMSFLDAAQKHGTPTWIKIDIQGAEDDLLMGTFRDWVLENAISVYLEVHGNNARLVWPEFKQIGPIHYFLNAKAR